MSINALVKLGSLFYSWGIILYLTALSSSNYDDVFIDNGTVYHIFEILEIKPGHIHLRISQKKRSESILKTR